MRNQEHQSPCGMELGDLVIYLGRLYVLRGLDPMGLPDRCADLEDALTGARLRAPVSQLEPAPLPST
jgi:hypothetical protein